MARRRPLRTTDPRDLSTFAARIRHARLACDLSQEELAKRISIVTGKSTSKALVSKWERGSVSNPQIETFQALSAITGFRDQWLIKGTGQDRVSLANQKHLDAQALEAAIRSVLGSCNDHQVESILALYQILAIGSRLDKRALRDLQSLVSRQGPAI